MKGMCGMAKKSYKLDREEAALARDMKENPQDWVSSSPELKAKVVQAAKEHAATGKRDRQVNLRWDDWMVENATQRAQEEGLPGYQTLVYSVMYRYLTGKLVDPEVAAARANVRRKS
jgi:predicted DNA binding CopG/RHH family protein